MVAWDRPSNCNCTGVNPNIQMWIPSLQIQWEVDGRAIAELVELSREGREGYMHANAIIGKLIKKRCDNIPLKQPSRFVTVGVKNAWQKIEDS